MLNLYGKKDLVSKMTFLKKPDEEISLSNILGIKGDFSFFGSTKNILTEKQYSKNLITKIETIIDQIGKILGILLNLDANISIVVLEQLRASIQTLIEIELSATQSIEMNKKISVSKDYHIQFDILLSTIQKQIEILEDNLLLSINPLQTKMEKGVESLVELFFNSSHIYTRLLSNINIVIGSDANILVTKAILKKELFYSLAFLLGAVTTNEKMLSKIKEFQLENELSISVGALVAFFYSLDDHYLKTMFSLEEVTMKEMSYGTK